MSADPRPRCPGSGAEAACGYEQDGKVRTICPVCQRPVPAKIVRTGNTYSFPNGLMMHASWLQVLPHPLITE